MDVIDRIGPVKAWFGTLLAGIAVFGGGVAVAPGTFWDGFLWRYFWGPVYADAHNAGCAIRDGGAVSLGGATYPESCAAAVERGAIAVEPGYTVVSEIGYMLLGAFFLFGVYLLMTRLHLGHDRRLVFALLPFVLFGGVLRVVEDTNNFLFEQQLRAGEATEMAIAYPLNTLLISPLIYLTVFGLTFLAIVCSVALSRRDLVESYHRTLAGMGTILLVVTFAGLVVLAMSNDRISFYPQFLITTVVVATLLSGGIYAATERFAPEITAGLGTVALTVLWAHAIDGVSNVLSTDWTDALGVPLVYRPKHPANDFIIRMTETIQPDALTTAIGSAWPFLMLKLVVAWAIVWLFTEEFVEDSPRLAYLVLIAIIAVGLGPGTRDLVRATFAI